MFDTDVSIQQPVMFDILIVEIPESRDEYPPRYANF